MPRLFSKINNVIAQNGIAGLTKKALCRVGLYRGYDYYLKSAPEYVDFDCEREEKLFPIENDTAVKAVAVYTANGQTLLEDVGVAKQCGIYGFCFTNLTVAREFCKTKLNFHFCVINGDEEFKSDSRYIQVQGNPLETDIIDKKIYNYSLFDKKEGLINYIKLAAAVVFGYNRASGYPVCLANSQRPFVCFSLKSFYEWALFAADYLEKGFSADQRLLFVNSWQSLDPANSFGYAKINALSKALSKKPFYDDLCVISGGGKASQKRVAVHVHMFYTETLDETILNINKIPFEFDCFVSTDTVQKADYISAMLKEKCRCKNAVVEVFENRGRDVAPFILQMAKHIDNYDYICHIHSKRTVTGDHGNDWRKYIFRHLFGSEEYIKALFEKLENSLVGIMFPPTFPPLENQAGWGNNLAGSKSVLLRLGIDTHLPQEPIFPVGNMFWAKTDAIKQVFKAGFGANDFAKEAGQLNDTPAHCIERLWVYVAKHNGYDYCKVFNNIEKEIVLKDKRRIAFYAHYNSDGKLSDEDVQSLNAYRKVFDTVIFVSNSALDEPAKQQLCTLADKVFERDNSGYDFAAWKYGMEQLGQENIMRYDQAAFINNSTFAPIYDIKCVFAKMEQSEASFWGITLFPAVKEKKYLNTNGIAEHIQSYFVVFEQDILKSGVLFEFFEGLGQTDDLKQAIANGEVALTKFLKSKGYSKAPYIEESNYICKYLADYSIPYTRPASLAVLGSPLIKKKAYGIMPIDQKVKLEYFLDKLKGAVTKGGYKDE